MRLSKTHIATVAWFLTAGLTVLTAIWQAQIVVAREASERRHHPPPPMKTRHALRGDVIKKARGEVFADYVARCEKGMSDKEIRWIIEDFVTARLDRGLRTASPEEFLEQRQAEQHWYLAALQDALQLSPEQSNEASHHLDGLLELAKTRFLSSIEPNQHTFEQAGNSYRIIEASPIHELIDAGKWLGIERGGFLPADLCTLSKEQEGLTGKPVHDEDPPTESDGPPPMRVDAPRKIDSIRTILPLLPSQEMKLTQGNPHADAAGQDETNELLPIQGLHPSQLKVLLLMHPEMAKEISEILDQPKR